MHKISILIADDHKLIRDTWAYILNNDPRFEVVAQCGDALEAIDQAREKKPDIILMDINMAPVSGLEATQRILQAMPGANIIGVSMHSEPAYAKKMLELGGRAYVTKNSSREEMFSAILEVKAGRKYMCEEIRNLLALQLEEAADQMKDVQILTERELEIIEKLKEGRSSKEISSDLLISLKTVETHRHNILKKLRLKNTAALVNYMNNRAIYM